jgi:hypothetical protein
MSGGASPLMVMASRFPYGTPLGRLDDDWEGLTKLVGAERPDLVLLQGCSGWKRCEWALPQVRSDLGMTVLVAPSGCDLPTVLCYRPERLSLVTWDVAHGDRTFHGFGIGVFADERSGRQFVATSADLNPWSAELAEREASLIGDLTGAGEVPAIVAAHFNHRPDSRGDEGPSVADWSGWPGLTDVRDHVGREAAAESGAEDGPARAAHTYVSDALVPGIRSYREHTTGKHTVTACAFELV